MNLLVLLADGFEEVEALTVVDYLRRLGGLRVDMVSISGEREVRGAHDIRVLADDLIDRIDPRDYRGVVIPGGLPGATNLRDSEKVIDIVKYMDGERNLIAAICAGPIVLARAGVIAGRRITSFPGLEDEFKEATYVEDKVALDGHLITSRGPALALEFALEISNYLLGREKVEELKDSILYDKLFEGQ